MVATPTAARTGLVQHDHYLQHDTGKNHPENADRLQAVYDMLETCEYRAHCRRLAPQPCSVDELALVHARGYIAKIAATAMRPFACLGADTSVCADSYLAAQLAVGGTLQAIREVWEGRLANALALVRPPGHHAEAARAMGFCLFNNVAIGAVYARRTLGARRVLIVDWDVHHGNGTQDIFYEDPDVFYLSLHQHPQYPGTGLAHETGRGAGEGTTLNLPMRAGLEPEAYVEALLGAVDRAAGFGADMVFISAGFDAAKDDPIGGFTLEPDHFALLTHELVERTRPTAAGRVVSLLEGGYNPPELGRCVTAHLTALTEAAAGAGAA